MELCLEYLINQQLDYKTMILNFVIKTAKLFQKPNFFPLTFELSKGTTI